MSKKYLRLQLASTIIMELATPDTTNIQRKIEIRPVQRPREICSFGPAMSYEKNSPLINGPIGLKAVLAHREKPSRPNASPCENSPPSKVWNDGKGLRTTG